MSNHNDPALGESLSRRGKYAPTPDINGHTEHIPAPDEHPDDPVPPPRQVAPVCELADEFGHWPATTRQRRARVRSRVPTPAACAGRSTHAYAVTV
jgi:hypothetical protein